VAKGINSFLATFNINAEDGTVHKRIVEVVYVSNDRSIKEFELFVAEQSQPWAAIPWNDDRILEIKAAYNFHDVP